MKDSCLSGRIILVTGGGKGIGREITRISGTLGATVYICGRNLEALQKSAGEMSEDGRKVVPVQTDVRDPEACRKLIERIRSETGKLDAVINNAGMSMRGSLEETDPSVVRAMFEINVLGAAYITRYAIPMLKESKGSVIFISSLSALHGLPFIGPYGSSKLALKGLSESLRAELHPSGVHVGIVHVSFTENDPNKVVYGNDGSMISLNRSRNTHTQAQTAERVVRCLVKRKNEMTLSAMGKGAAFLYRFFPRLSDFLISRFSANSAMFK